MQKKMKNAFQAMTAVSLFGFGAMATPVHAAEWEWVLTPYLWGSDTSVDVFVNDEPVIGGDLSFSGLIDKLDFAAQIHFEGRRGKGGFFLDTTYLDTGDSLITEGRPLLPDGTEVRTDTKTVMVEAGGTIRPGGETHGFDLLFGVRITDTDMTIDITPPSPAPVRRRSIASLLARLACRRIVAIDSL